MGLVSFETYNGRKQSYCTFIDAFEPKHTLLGTITKLHSPLQRTYLYFEHYSQKSVKSYKQSNDLERVHC
jgi:hypothetical protein